MHADALPPQAADDGSWLGPVLSALLIHLLLALVFTLAWRWSPERRTELAAGNPSLEASLDVSAADARVARQALKAEAEPFTPPAPAPLPEPAPEDSVPPPQPIPEPRPQDAPTPQQANAQQRVAQPDTVDQQQVSAMAESEEKARQEQEAKRRQQQIDLTEERKRQEQAEQQRRLAKQQEQAQKDKVAERQAQAQAERDRKLAELRKKREQLEAQMARDAKQVSLAQQKVRQLEAARAQSGSNAASASAAAGAGGSSDDLSAKYAAAIQQAVRAQWVRPDSVPLGQKCTIQIRQLPGGSVVEAQVAANCPFDDSGRRSIEAAVLRAQPLPYRGYESVFSRTLTFNFTAQDP